MSLDRYTLFSFQFVYRIVIDIERIIIFIEYDVFL